MFVGFLFFVGFLLFLICSFVEAIESLGAAPKDLGEVERVLAFGWLLPEPASRQLHVWKTALLATASSTAKRKGAGAAAAASGAAAAAKSRKTAAAKDADEDLANLFGQA